jgi:aromatic ring-opening dioxygenase catalytic subunit (LigB family)
MRSLKQTLLEEYREESFKGIVILSAHWEETEITIDQPTGPTTTLYDNGEIPGDRSTYTVPTDANLASHVHELLASQGIQSTLKPRAEGFDHGVLIPLKLIFPEAKVPILQVSLHSNLDIATHVKLGEALAPLRREGVLIIGSGQITHNFRAMKAYPDKIDPRTVEFTEYFRKVIEGTNESNYEERKQALIASPSVAPHFDYQHPRTEHFIPLAVAFGAASPGTAGEGEGQSLQVQRLFHHVAMGAMATDAYLFTSH